MLRPTAERALDRGAHAAYGSRPPAVPFTGPMDPAGVLNADRRLAGLATHSCTGRDLWEAYELVRVA
ncbi:hypothetical protein SUDANB176_03656 [Streptomyces sp. enrichment culture]